MSVTEYEHGTLRAYHRMPCRCDDCRRAKKYSRMLREREKGRGDYSNALLDTAPARQHIESLIEAGLTHQDIMRVAGLNGHTYHRIARKPGTRAKGAIIQRVLNVQPSMALPGKVPAKASTLRMRALYALGYSERRIATMMGIPSGSLNLGSRTRPSVYRTKAQRLIDVCKEIGDTPGPDEEARRRAQRWGYRVPADFDVDLFYDVRWDGVEHEVPMPEERIDALLEDVDEIESFLREPNDDHERRLNRELVEARLGVSYRYIVKLRSQRASRDWKRKRRAA